MKRRLITPIRAFSVIKGEKTAASAQGPLIQPVPAEKLRAWLPPERIPFKSSQDIPLNGKRHLPQQRTLEALKLGLHISASGFNIYLSGEADLGRSVLLRDLLVPYAKKGQTPPDLIYVYNFRDPDSPVLIKLAAGQGRKIKSARAKSFARIRKEILRRIEEAPHTQSRSLLMSRLHTRRERLMKQMNRMAMTSGFNLGLDDSGGMTLYPLLEGKRLSEQEFEGLEPPLRAELKLKSESLLEPISAFMRKLAKAEEDFLDQERSLERDLLQDVLKLCLEPLEKKFATADEEKKLEVFFKDLREHTLENIESLLPPDFQMKSQRPQPAPAPYSYDPQPQYDLAPRYDVNLFVDNAEGGGAPVVFENHPTLANLMGCVERESEMGALVTDFTLIKSGSIHRANGGYLILRMEDALQYPEAWEALLRSLRAGRARMEEAEGESAGRTKGISPEPVPLSLKVILVGKEDLYEMLLMADDRFSKLFKIKAHLSEHMPRNSAGIRTYLSHMRRIIEDDALLPFDQGAMAGLVDYGSRIIEDQQKLSLKYPILREVMVEASAQASLGGKKKVSAAILRKTLDARNFRSNLVEEAFMEEYDRGIIKVATSGEAVGKVNGLSVSFYGDFEFGLPHEISCTVGVGTGGIIDLERDAELGGPIHTKAMMILKSYLVGAFARNKPLVLTGSLGFEQNYSGIEGDSASGAELAALLSALSGVPLRLSLAFTGALGQDGRIMAVGGVTRKIEGFFQVCKRQGLTGEQGVILPKDNLCHVLLQGEVFEAVRTGKFHVYAVSHISEAMEILSGLPSGKAGRDGTYAKGSVYALTDARLAELTRISLRCNGVTASSRPFR
ncbi:MAG: AAA family ATPase [Desulfovibrio sp.]|jgi:predicted ATP-dependent protease|nr:AAA family ATPase [Desulfovibrio sp.]